MNHRTAPESRWRGEAVPRLAHNRAFSCSGYRRCSAPGCSVSPAPGALRTPRSCDPGRGWDRSCNIPLRSSGARYRLTGRGIDRPSGWQPSVPHVHCRLPGTTPRSGARPWQTSSRSRRLRTGERDHAPGHRAPQ